MASETTCLGGADGPVVAHQNVQTLGSVPPPPLTPLSLNPALSISPSCLPNAYCVSWG